MMQMQNKAAELARQHHRLIPNQHGCCMFRPAYPALSPWAVHSAGGCSQRQVHAAGLGREQGEMAVTTRDLHLSFGSGQDLRPVLRGVDFQVQRGSLHMLLGPNGCGKSTLLKVLGGLIPFTRGQVLTDQPTGFVFQNPDHQVVMPTVAADVAFGLGRYDMPEAQVRHAVESALALVNMQHTMSRATHTLSGGQRQRIAIAGALAENPRLLLLDELTTFLDVEDQFGVLEAVVNITRRGCVTTVAADKQSNNGTSSNGNSTSPSPDRGIPPPASNGAPRSGSSMEMLDAVGVGAEPVTAIWVTHRFEELKYADSASYMAEGRVIFTGSGEEMRAFLKRLGAPVPA